MGINVREKTIEEIEDRLTEMNTTLSKIAYLESAAKEHGFSLELKRHVLGKLTVLYQERKMYERAARKMAEKAGLEITFREKIESYLSAAELYAIAGKVNDSEDMFLRSMRDATLEQKNKIKLARKNIYLTLAKECETKGKRASAAKFYEKLIKMKLDEIEKKEVKEKLISIYNALGQFREARLLQGA